VAYTIFFTAYKARCVSSLYRNIYSFIQYALSLGTVVNYHGIPVAEYERYRLETQKSTFPTLPAQLQVLVICRLEGHPEDRDRKADTYTI
jgi:hypothetical protein